MNQLCVCSDNENRDDAYSLFPVLRRNVKDDAVQLIGQLWCHAVDLRESLLRLLEFGGFRWLWFRN